MDSRERIERAINHKQPDRVPIDLGGSLVTGMHVNTVYKLRQALGLDESGTPVKVVDPFQMLGEIKADLREALGVDVVGLGGQTNFFGFKNEGWKPWETFQGIPVLVPEKFNIEPEANGDLLMYPQGDKSAAPSGRMPEGGYYFDAVIRQEPIDDDNLNIEDNLEEFGPISEEELKYLKQEAQRLYRETDKAIFGSFGGTSFGDIAMVPAPWLKDPKGIRDVEEWYVSTISRRDYVYQVFEKQCEIGLKNLEKIYDVVGDKISVAFVTGTDFGTQTGPFISPEAYRDLFKPFHKKVNDWIHEHTEWKTFIHSCGSILALLDDFVDAGFDILNPVQCSAADMEPDVLKEKYGDKIVFWGGGVDTQKTLPFSSEEDVREEVKERLRIFGSDGGYVFNTIHNVQANTPVANVKAMYEVVRKDGQYHRRCI